MKLTDKIMCIQHAYSCAIISSYFLSVRMCVCDYYSISNFFSLYIWHFVSLLFVSVCDYLSFPLTIIVIQGLATAVLTTPSVWSLTLI